MSRLKVLCMRAYKVHARQIYQKEVTTPNKVQQCKQRDIGSMNPILLLWPHVSQNTFIIRMKSGNFGHWVNSDIHLQTVEIQM